MDVGYIITDPERPETLGLLDGILLDRVYADDVRTGTRPGLAACLESLHHGDTLHVASEMQLSTDFIECVSLLGRIARLGADVRLDKAKKVITSAASPFRSVNEAVARALLEFRAAFARQRSLEGTARAMNAGARFGRRAAPLPDNFDDVYRQWAGGKITGAEAARRCGMKTATFRFHARKRLGV